mgnify:CR=1 FL=1
MKLQTKIWLVAIFVFVVCLRIWVSFQTSELNYDGYSVARQVEYISETGLPLINDDLSYAGRLNIVSPLYPYFLAFFDLFLPLSFVLKVIPNILAALIVFVVFYLSMFMIKDEKVSLLVAFLGGIIPVFFNVTINNASPLSAAVPLFFLVVYYFLRTNQEPIYLNRLIISMVLLVILSPVSLILSVSLIIYLMMLKIQNFRESLREGEIVLFFTFLVLWLNLLIFKKALEIHGGSVIRQNIPITIIQDSFSNITFIQSIYGVGIIALIFGLFAIYSGLFISSKKSITLMMSIVITVFFLLWFRLIELATGLIFLGVSFTALSSHSINYVLVSVSKMKLKNSLIWFLIVFVVISLGLFAPNVSFAMSVSGNVPSKYDMDGFYWLKNNTPNSSVVLVLPSEGSAMSYFSDRKNVMDDNYLLIRNIDKRYEDSNRVFSDVFLTTALSRLNYYSVNYVMITEKNYISNNISSLKYAGDCVVLVWSHPENDVPKIYRVDCVLNTRSG